MSRQPYTEVTEPEHHEPEEDIHGDAEEEQAERHVRPRWYVEDGMGKKILGFVVIVLVLGLLWYAYQRHVAAQSTDGSITMDDTTPKVVQEAAPDPPAVKKTTASTPAPAATSAAPTPPVIPATDSIAPNPTNGMTFGGSGKFQVYRQGNLTWRVDTESGKTCIVFATMEEWKKPIVYEHGCANS